MLEWTKDENKVKSLLSRESTDRRTPLALTRSGNPLSRFDWSRFKYTTSSDLSPFHSPFVPFFPSFFPFSFFLFLFLSAIKSHLHCHGSVSVVQCHRHLPAAASMRNLSGDVDETLALIPQTQAHHLHRHCVCFNVLTILPQHEEAARSGCQSAETSAAEHRYIHSSGPETYPASPNSDGHA